LKKEYNGLPFNQILNDLNDICRHTTAEILVGFLKANGKMVLDEIIDASLLASDCVAKYKEICYDRTPDNMNTIENLLTNNIKNLNCGFTVAYKKVHENSRLAYVFESIKHLLYYDFYETGKAYRSYSDESIKIKKCQNCGRYFVLKGRSTAIYCDYPAPQNLSFNCNDPQMTRFYGQSDTEIKAKKRRHRIFTTWQNRLRSNPEDTTAQEIFENFKERDAEFKIAVENNTQTEMQYYEFLKNFPTPRQYKDNPEQYANAINGTEEE
jgi:hypothetical protein